MLLSSLLTTPTTGIGVNDYNKNLPQEETIAEPGEYSSDANQWKPWAEAKDFLGFGAASRDREFQHNEAILQRNYQTSSMNLQHLHNKEIMDYAEKIERNKYKNAVEGLKEAGLNPTLALSMASGVSTPSSSAMSGASGKGSSAGTGSAIGLVQAITQLIGTMADKNTTINKYK